MVEILVNVSKSKVELIVSYNSISNVSLEGLDYIREKGEDIMAKYNKELLLKEAAKIGSLPQGTPLPKMPGWSPNHIKTGRDWMGRSHLLERYLEAYLQRRNISVEKTKSRLKKP